MVRSSQKSIVIGSKIFQNLQAAPRVHKYYTGRWDCRVNVGDLQAHLTDLGVNIKVCELNVARHEKFRSFRFECDSSFHSTITNPEKWPKGVIVKRWVEIKKRDNEGGSNSARLVRNSPDWGYLNTQLK